VGLWVQDGAFSRLVSG